MKRKLPTYQMDNPETNRISDYVESTSKKAKPDSAATYQKAFRPLVDYSLSEDDDGSFEMSSFQSRGHSDAGSMGSCRRVLHRRNGSQTSDNAMLSRMTPCLNYVKHPEHVRCAQNADRCGFIQHDGVKVLNSDSVQLPNEQVLRTCLEILSPDISILRTREQFLKTREEVLRNAEVVKPKKTRFMNIFRKSFLKKFKTDTGVFRFCGLRKPKSPKIQL